MIARCAWFWTSAASPPSRKRVDEPRDVGHRRQAAGRAARSMGQSTVDRYLLEQPPEMRAQPGRADELKRVGELVEDDPVEERAPGRRRARWTAFSRFGATNSSRGTPVGLEQRELVLAEHALGHVADHEARLGRQRRARWPSAAVRRAGQPNEPLLESLVDGRPEHPRCRRWGRRPGSTDRPPRFPDGGWGGVDFPSTHLTVRLRLARAQLPCRDRLRSSASRLTPPRSTPIWRASNR